MKQLWICICIVLGNAYLHGAATFIGPKEIQSLYPPYLENVIRTASDPDTVRASMFTFLRTTIGLTSDTPPSDQQQKVKKLQLLFDAVKNNLYAFSSEKILPQYLSMQYDRLRRRLIALQQIPLYLVSVVGAYVESTKRALNEAEEKANSLQDQQAKIAEQDRLSGERKKLEDVETWYKEQADTWDEKIKDVEYKVRAMSKELAELSEEAARETIENK